MGYVIKYVKHFSGFIAAAVAIAKPPHAFVELGHVELILMENQ
jgi:hypothetical protein